MIARIRQWAPTIGDGALAVGVGAGLTFLFWRALVFTSAGFLGGDIYNYYFPLRKLYADGLHAGGIYLWHNGIGNGVPVLGESQTGAFYLPYLLAYRFLDLANAYNAVFLFHYVLAFVGSFALGRQLGLARLSSCFVATAFVFGWFPERACLEWAIVTGSWCPIVVAFSLAVMDGKVRSAGLPLVASVAMQLLAGHFQLAFVTIVGVGILAIAKCALARDKTTVQRAATTLACLIIGFLVAAPQLAPAWMLKQRSQRQDDAFAKSVDFGNVPLWYWSQMLFPLEVYPQSEELIRRHGATTNLVEAQLYPGRVSLALLALAPFAWRSRRRTGPGLAVACAPWIVLLAAGLILAEGSAFAFLNRLPGFGYFRYPGRYGMLAALAAAALAGMVADGLFVRGAQSIAGRALAWVLGSCCLALSIADFYAVRNARGESQVGYATIVPEAPIRLLPQTFLTKLLTASSRVLAMDGNTLSLFGCSCVPPYLGLGPAEYYQIWGKFPNVFRGETELTPAIAETLKRMGVSHLLTEKPLPESWKIQLVWSGHDPFLHRRWGRPANEPLFLYQTTLGRAYLLEASGAVIEGEGNYVDRNVQVEPHRVMAPYSCSLGSAALVLTDLAYPGWHSTLMHPVNALPTEKDGMFRAIRVKDRVGVAVWHYVDVGVLIGLGIALSTTLAGCLALACARFGYCSRRAMPAPTAPRKLPQPT